MDYDAHLMWLKERERNLSLRGEENLEVAAAIAEVRRQIEHAEQARNLALMAVCLKHFGGPRAKRCVKH
jgi:hypothetical protein